MQQKVYMPSYAEWLTCFEMEQQVEQMRCRVAETTPTQRTRLELPCRCFAARRPGQVAELTTMICARNSRILRCEHWQPIPRKYFKSIENLSTLARLLF